MTDPISNELLPCPFCGEIPLSHRAKAGIVRIVCEDCGVDGPFVAGDPEDQRTWEDAVAAWNRRQSPAGVEPCATEGCENAATEHFEAGGVGSHYCKYCAAKVRSLSVKEPAGVEPVAWQCFDCIMEQWSVIDDAELAAARSRRDGEWIVRPLYASPPKAVTITDSAVEQVLAWVRDDVLPAYGISHATRASDPEMAEGARATLTAALSGEAHNGQ